MTKRDILVLVSPSVVLVIIAVFAFMAAADISQRHTAEREQASRQKFDTFVAAVQSGQRQVTPDTALELIKQSRSISESLWLADADTGKMMRDFGFMAVFGIFLQISVAVRLYKKLRKP